MQLVSMTCLPDSHLQRDCDLHLHIPLIREVCPFNLAPLSSPTLQMLLGDTLVATIVQVCVLCCMSQ